MTGSAVLPICCTTCRWRMRSDAQAVMLWKQSDQWLLLPCFYRQPVQLQQADNGAGDECSGFQSAGAITGKVSIARSSKHRSLDISLTYTPVSHRGQPMAAEQTCFFEMGVSG